MSEDQSDQPIKRVYLRVPENYYKMTEAEQDEVLGQMADMMITELGIGDGESRTEA